MADLAADLAQLNKDLKDVCEWLVDNPSDADLLAMKADLEENISLLKSQITPEAPPPPPAEPPKYDMTKHPKFRKVGGDSNADDPPPPPPDDVKTAFNVNDQVLAKYSADKQWYPATIIGKAGSSSDPLYTVKFNGYPDKETKRKYEVRAIENKKRKADGTPAAAAAATAAAATTTTGPPPPPPSPKVLQHGTVITAAPEIDPTLVQKREPSKVSDGPTRMAPAPKKLKGNRTLEKAKSSWNDWQKSGPKKPVVGAASKKLGKDSQFRTPDLPNAKVGFTGSGRPMSKDQVRMKWEYGRDEPED